MLVLWDWQSWHPTSTRALVRTCLHLRFPTQLWAALSSGLSPAALQSAVRLRPTPGQSVLTWVVASQPSQPDHCPGQPADGERSIISVTALLLGLSYKDHTLIIALIISVITHMCWQDVCCFPFFEDNLSSELERQGRTVECLQWSLKWWYFDEYCRPTQPTSAASTITCLQTSLCSSDRLPQLLPGRISQTKWESQDWPAANLHPWRILFFLPGS